MFPFCASYKLDIVRKIYKNVEVSILCNFIFLSFQRYK